MPGLDRSGDIALDVGAHKAGDLYRLRRSAKPAGHVPPLEPQPVLAAYLREMIAAKRWRNLQAGNQRVSNRRGTLALDISGATGESGPEIRPTAAPRPGRSRPPSPRAG